jgi:hypothetical protein
MTEVWFRNPVTYIRECAEMLTPNIVWDRGLLRKNRIDAQRHVEVHLPSVVDYRLLLVGDQGSAELRRGYGLSSPYAVYPTWEYGQDTIPELESMLRTQVTPRGPTPDECGVPGQEHRVVVIRPPDARTKIGDAFYLTLSQLQLEYPDAIVHIHGTYSFRILFGLGLASGDWDPHEDARRGRIVLGSGRKIPHEDAPSHAGWTALSGFRSADLAIARNRTMFNIASANWAGMNYSSTDKWRVRPGSGPVTSVRDTRKIPVAGDKIACDHCSLAPTCKLHRDGGVCVVEGSDTSALAKYFKTRDSGSIIDGLGRLIETQLHRAEKGLEAEKVSDELDPEVTKILKHVFDGGVKLAKLVDPNLAGGTKVGIFVGGNGAGAVGPTTPNAMVAAVIAELEAQGIERADIDMETVATYIAATNRPAIEVTSS